MSYPNFEPSLKNLSFVQNYVLRRKILFYYDFFPKWTMHFYFELHYSVEGAKAVAEGCCTST